MTVKRLVAIGLAGAIAAAVSGHAVVQPAAPRITYRRGIDSPPPRRKPRPKPVSSARGAKKRAARLAHIETVREQQAQGLEWRKGPLGNDRGSERAAFLAGPTGRDRRAA